ncbi:MAG: hypothetical protein MUF54_03795 [Polyangiaceae bacterium]|nr:hypothetical protein [Polyangiaceae bacterium]
MSSVVARKRDATATRQALPTTAERVICVAYVLCQPRQLLERLRGMDLAATSTQRGIPEHTFSLIFPGVLADGSPQPTDRRACVAKRRSIEPDSTVVWQTDRSRYATGGAHP